VGNYNICLLASRLLTGWTSTWLTEEWIIQVGPSVRRGRWWATSCRPFNLPTMLKGEFLNMVDRGVDNSGRCECEKKVLVAVISYD
jgi:hypothetical protein